MMISHILLLLSVLLMIQIANGEKTKRENYDTKPDTYHKKDEYYKKPVRCPAGFFLSKYNKCLPCPKGTFQDIRGKKYCRKCPKGKTTRSEGTTDKCMCFDPHARRTRCVKNCYGLRPGDYQSCLGCKFFASCIGDYFKIDGRRCPHYLVWDDNCKRCEFKSNTCYFKKH